MAGYLFEEECKSYLLPELQAPSEGKNVQYDEYDNVKAPHAFPGALLDSQNKINECYTSYLVAWSLLEDGSISDATSRTAYLSMLDTCPDLTLMSKWQDAINNGLFASHKFTAEHVVGSESFDDSAQKLMDDFNESVKEGNIEETGFSKLTAKFAAEAEADREGFIKSAEQLSGGYIPEFKETKRITAEEFEENSKQWTADFKADLWGKMMPAEDDAFNVKKMENSFFGAMKAEAAKVNPDACLDKVHL
uniref:Uncharacterized protein n=1 Tax=Paramoeba aestuarina TaxID=180227 RepID=A0A7S4N5M1_9EUKA|mmetsp:Transcript_11203/g.16946  ORF Transcript_11203/g.16946 Transcript_11203/m.16946 type:complete len:249 (+) Transcript_11203:85-831(+)|eukprot:CAMPEP_0201506484 /NCGR_PEP_ID=MMETSP0161_2-20130828/408_1 /ASSEMBLY_ACC=CAM_ASM_000251 /TAXON_ID=180227 /ORGANISM="Neoparamoeba aestuarina, Strain SoJaBio B1-5/56/2" /LENGTH=248 /DNA_ID=CAMNT_0047900587 /DNA_START=108 /DNA_END=854 /DNA_ORIENTATION=-